MMAKKFLKQIAWAIKLSERKFSADLPLDNLADKESA